MTLSRKTPLRRTPMRAVSKARAAANRVRRVAEAVLYEVAPWCARCGDPNVDLHGHELIGRAQGGDFTDPECLLCNTCNGWCEDNPIVAAWQGWKTPPKHPTAPCIASGACPRGAHPLGEKCEAAA